MKVSEVITYFNAIQTMSNFYDELLVSDGFFEWLRATVNESSLLSLPLPTQPFQRPASTPQYLPSTLLMPPLLMTKIISMTLMIEFGDHYSHDVQMRPAERPWCLKEATYTTMMQEFGDLWNHDVQMRLMCKWVELCDYDALMRQTTRPWCLKQAN